MKDIKKIINDKLYIIAFLAIISLPLIQISTEVFPKSKFDENREKKSLPDVKNFETLSDYFKEFEEYYKDNFGFRSELINLKSTVDLKVFRESSSSDVILGKNDYLFYKEELDDYKGKLLMSDTEIDALAKKLKDFQENLKSRGKNFIFAIAPNKSTIYPEYIKNQDFSPQNNLDNLQKALDKYGVNYVDFKKVMLDNKDEYELYYKRDTHWNPIAAVLAGDAMLQKINNLYGTNYSLKPTNSKKGYYYGDLDRILGIDSKIPEWQTDYEIKNSESSQLSKVLFYGDSFGGTIQPLTQNFFNQQIDLHNKHTPLEDTYPSLSENSNLIIFEIVERYLSTLKDYNFDIFDNNLDDVINQFNSYELSFDKENPKVKFNDIAYTKLENTHYYLSTKSLEGNIEFNINEKLSPQKLYLDLNKLTEPLVLKFYWSDDSQNYTEEKCIPIKLIPSKTKYLIDISQFDFNGTWLKIEFPKELNKSLDINSLKILTK